MNKSRVAFLIVMVVFSGKIFSITEDDKKVIEAAKQGDSKTIEDIWSDHTAEHKSYFNAQDDNKATALYYAAQKINQRAKNENYSDIVKFLLDEVGSDPNIADKNGITPLMNAAGSGDLASLQFLVDDSRTEVNKVDSKGRTALDLASSKPRRVILIAKGAKTSKELAVNPLNKLSQAFTDLITSLQTLGASLS